MLALAAYGILPGCGPSLRQRLREEIDQANLIVRRCSNLRGWTSRVATTSAPGDADLEEFYRLFVRGGRDVKRGGSEAKIAKTLAELIRPPGLGNACFAVDNTFKAAQKAKTVLDLIRELPALDQAVANCVVDGSHEAHRLWGLWQARWQALYEPVKRVRASDAQTRVQALVRAAAHRFGHSVAGLVYPTLRRAVARLNDLIISVDKSSYGAASAAVWFYSPTVYRRLDEELAYSLRQGTNAGELHNLMVAWGLDPTALLAEACRNYEVEADGRGAVDLDGLLVRVLGHYIERDQKSDELPDRKGRPGEQKQGEPTLDLAAAAAIQAERALLVKVAQHSDHSAADLDALLGGFERTSGREAWAAEVAARFVRDGKLELPIDQWPAARAVEQLPASKLDDALDGAKPRRPLTPNGGRSSERESAALEQRQTSLQRELDQLKSHLESVVAEGAWDRRLFAELLLMQSFCRDVESLAERRGLKRGEVVCVPAQAVRGGTEAVRFNLRFDFNYTKGWWNLQAPHKHCCDGTKDRALCSSPNESECDLKQDAGVGHASAFLAELYPKLDALLKAMAAGSSSHATPTLQFEAGCTSDPFHPEDKLPKHFAKHFAPIPPEVAQYGTGKDEMKRNDLLGRLRIWSLAKALHPTGPKVGIVDNCSSPPRVASKSWTGCVQYDQPAPYVNLTLSH